MVKVPCRMIKSEVDFIPLALSVSSSVCEVPPQFPQSELNCPSALVLAFWLPPPVVSWKAPPAISNVHLESSPSNCD